MDPVTVAVLALLSGPTPWTTFRIGNGSSGQCTVAVPEVCLEVNRFDDPHSVHVRYPGRPGHVIATLTGTVGKDIWDRAAARAAADEAAAAAADTDEAARAAFLRQFGR